MNFANRQHLYLFIIIFLSGFLLFWDIGIHNISEWDEARNGVIAYNMYHNGDYVNFYYGGELDTWTTKPPLFIWLIVSSYKIFGFNEFALRLPSVISSLLYFIIFFKLITLHSNKTKAFIASLILMSSAAIIGWHAGRTGDFDALLSLMLLCSAYYFILYIKHKKNYSLYLTALFTGLAFYTKGTAGLIFLPGFLLFTIVSKKTKSLFNNKHTYFAILLGLAIILSWILLVSLYGKNTATPFYNTSNSIEAMLFHDTYKRLTDHQFYTNRVPDKFVFIHNLDTEMNVWNYFFYASVLIGIITIYKNRKKLNTFLNKHRDGLILFAISIVTPIIITFSLSAHIYSWYFVPIWGFIAVFIAEAIYIIRKEFFKYVYVVFTAIFVFLYIRLFNYLDARPDDLHFALTKANKDIVHAKDAIMITPAKQDLVLYLTWLNIPYHIATTIKEVSSDKTLIIVDKAYSYPNIVQKIKPICNTKAYHIGYITR